MSNGQTNPASVQSPLTLLMPVKADKVYELKSQLIPLQAALTTGLDEIGIVHFVRVMILPNTNTLGIITTYDGSFNDYIQAFVRNPIVAKVFDTFLTFISDELTPPTLPPAAALIPVQQNANAFIQWLNFFDATSEENEAAKLFGWYSAYPKLTVKQIIANAGGPGNVGRPTSGG
jgi:hypothetical protein